MYRQQKPASRPRASVKHRPSNAYPAFPLRTLKSCLGCVRLQYLQAKWFGRESRLLKKVSLEENEHLPFNASGELFFVSFDDVSEAGIGVFRKD